MLRTPALTVIKKITENVINQGKIPEVKSLLKIAK